MAISTRTGDRESEANWVVSLGIVQFRKTKDRKALNLFEKVLALTNYNFPAVKIVALAYAGRIHADLKHDETCNQYYSKARALSESFGSKKLHAVVYY